MSKACESNRMREFFPNQWNDFDSLLGQVFGPNTRRVARAAYAPAAVWQDDEAYHLELDLPGVARDDVELTLEKDVLQIVAERKQPEGERKGLHEERSYGKVTRTLTFPEAFDTEGITAELTDGVLRVKVAKAPEAKPHRIDVK